MKKNKTTFILILFFFIGLMILFYPALSNFTNSKLQSKSISHYEDLLKSLEIEDYDKYFDAATEYNQKLMKLKHPLFNHKRLKNYNDCGCLLYDLEKGFPLNITNFKLL